MPAPRVYCLRGFFSTVSRASTGRRGPGLPLPVLGLVGLVATLWSPAALPAPYRPADDSAVLERLPTRPGDPVQRELQGLRARHTGNPADVGAALDLARRYFNLALDSGDPRYVGYGEAALTAWRAA